MLVDTHAHLNFTEDKEGWCRRAKEAEVNKIICVGTSVEASRKCVEISEKYSSDDLQIYATVGIHAQDGKSDVDKFGSVDKCIVELRQILDQVENDNRRVVGVGECGYDIYLEGDTKQVTSATERKFQKELFVAQIRLAQELELPLLIHCRNAWKETFRLLERFQGSTSKSRTLKGLFHSWTGDWEAAKRVLEMGFYISFSGIVTFKNASRVQEVAKKMPSDGMLLETDSPFLTPHPLRGSKNEPKNVKITASFIAQLRNVPVDQLASVTSKNVGRLFGI